MRVELSWISLDSLVRIQAFQWVARLEAGKFFLGLLSRVRSGGTGASILACGRDRLFMGMLNLVSDFLQEVVGSYSDICWYGPLPIAPLIQLGGSSLSPQASR